MLFKKKGDTQKSSTQNLSGSTTSPTKEAPGAKVEAPKRSMRPIYRFVTGRAEKIDYSKGTSKEGE